MTTRTNRQVVLTLDTSQHDPPRIGWWLVTGPQPERDAYAIIELSWIYAEHAPRREVFSWYLHRRTPRYRYGTATYMDTIAHGEGYTRDDALEQIRNAWTQLLGLR